MRLYALELEVKRTKRLNRIAKKLGRERAIEKLLYEPSTHFLGHNYAAYFELDSQLTLAKLDNRLTDEALEDKYDSFTVVNYGLPF